jgi:hypothetical protein
MFLDGFLEAFVVGMGYAGQPSVDILVVGSDATAELFAPVDVGQLLGGKLVLDLGGLLIGLALASGDQ